MQAKIQIFAFEVAWWVQFFFDDPNINLSEPIDGAYLTVDYQFGQIEVKREHLQIIGILMGDVNGDGVVDAKDAKAILRHVVGRTSYPFNANCADVSGNGAISDEITPDIQEKLDRLEQFDNFEEIRQ